MACDIDFRRSILIGEFHIKKTPIVVGQAGGGGEAEPLSLVLHRIRKLSNFCNLRHISHLTIKTDNRKKMTCYTIFTLYTTLSFNKNYIKGKKVLGV